jgi:hypothetical protein
MDRDNSPHTPQRVVDFLALLGLLTSAEQYLICSIDQSVQQLHHEIDILRDEERRRNKDVADEIAVLRAEIAYSRTIQANFLSEIINTPGNRNLRQARANQHRRHRGGGILHTITNTPRNIQRPIHRDFENDQPQIPRCRVRRQQIGSNPPPYRR